jgi:hypothetical protein
VPGFASISLINTLLQLMLGAFISLVQLLKADMICCSDGAMRLDFAVAALGAGCLSLSMQCHHVVCRVHTKAQSAPKLSVVAVKPVKQQQQQHRQQQQAHRDAQPVGEPDEQQLPAKRMRVDADAVDQAAAQQNPQPQGSPARPSEQQQDDGSEQRTACTTEAADPLQTLLGVYCSESESDAEGGQHHSTDHDPQQHQPNQQLQQCKLQLPPAELMLQSDFQSTERGSPAVSPAVHVVKGGRYKPQEYGSWV